MRGREFVTLSAGNGAKRLIAIQTRDYARSFCKSRLRVCYSGHSGGSAEIRR
jgi:hypothetical protein